MGHGGLPRAVGRNAGWAKAWQPAQRGNRPARPAARVRRRGQHEQTVHGTTRWRACWWLVGGKVLPKISRGSRGRCRARRRGWGAPERRVNGEAAQTASGGGVHRWGGGSGGWRRRVWGPAASERQGGEKIARKCRDWQLGEELTGESWTTTVLDRNPRGRGEARALERRGQRGVEMGGRVEQREQGVSGSAAARQRGKEEGKGGGPGLGVPRGAGVPWGLAPTGGRRLAVPRAWRWWVTCAACARAGRTERGREGADEWVTAQCWAAVPLTSGAGLSAGAGARLRGRVWAGPRRNGDRPPGCTVWFLHLFELV
jgi:hypothetical protein